MACGNMSLMIIIPIFVKNKLKCFTKCDGVIDSIHYLLQNYNGKNRETIQMLLMPF